MSLIPLPPQGMPVRWYEYMVRDKVIAVSWLVFFVGGLSSPPQLHPYQSSDERLWQFVAAGYTFWTLYFGWAACSRLLARIANRVLPIGAAVGFLYIAIAAIVFLAIGAVYSWLGGGIYEFGKRLWLLNRGQTPPFIGRPRRVDRLRDRLSQIEELWRSGRITRQEYDRLRYNTMKRL